MGAGWPATQNAVSAPFVQICPLDSLPDGQSVGILPDARGQDRGVLVRQGGQVFAYVNTCPHYDRAPLGWKKDAFLNHARDHIMCAAHGALFRIADGACVIGPCLGQHLTAIPVQVQGGEVLAQLPAPLTKERRV